MGLAEHEPRRSSGLSRTVRRTTNRLVVVELDLGALVGEVGVLDRQVVEPELALHVAQQLLLGS